MSRLDFVRRQKPRIAWRHGCSIGTSELESNPKFSMAWCGLTLKGVGASAPTAGPAPKWLQPLKRCSAEFASLGYRLDSGHRRGEGDLTLGSPDRRVQVSGFRGAGLPGFLTCFGQKTRFFKNEPEKLLKTNDQAPIRDRNERKQEAEKLFKTRSRGKSESKTNRNQSGPCC